MDEDGKPSSVRMRLSRFAGHRGGRRGQGNTKTMEAKTDTREPRKRYDEGFKRDCVALLEKSGKGLKAFAAEMGINHWNLRDWRRLYRTPEPPRSPEQAESELLRLRRENESLRAQRDVFRECLGHPCRTAAERYARMKAMEHEHAITELCEAFAVSRSGYYRWRDATPGERSREDAQITEVLCAQGMRHSQRRIARLMRAARLHGVQRGRFKPQCVTRERPPFCAERILHGRRRGKPPTATTGASPREPAPNWLDQMPMPSAPNQIWVADITYAWTEEGWLYVAGVLDLCSRRIGGPASAGHLETSLPEAALRQAVLGRELPAGLLHHSDRGVQYASEHYSRMLELHGITPSMSRRANWYDNAHMESFWGTLKPGLISRRRFTTRHEAWLAILDYVETFYNRVRRHSALGYQSPVDYEHQLN